MKSVTGKVVIAAGASLAAAVTLVGLATTATTATAAPQAIAAATAATAAPLYVAADRAVQLGPCGGASFTTIQAAINAAHSGQEIVVCTGLYSTSVDVSKNVRLIGAGRPVIDAVGQNVGILVSASGATVQNFMVTGATGEGILAQGVSGVVLAHNLVQGNDQGKPTSSYRECQPTGSVPGDCGEGLHLMGVSDSQVLDNVVRANSGGILLTDETGPTHGNLIEGNLVEDNAYDCGITLPSHNGHAVGASGQPQPALGGVYGNTVTYNTIVGNGLADDAGAGVLLAGPFPGTAAYNNVISNNVIVGNAMSGVTVHSHAPGEDLNGNVVTGNTVVSDNVQGDSDAKDLAPTGVLVFAAPGAAPIHITVTGNRLDDNVWGIWASAGTVLTQANNSALGDNGSLYTAP
ncbi:MAG: right-handed parallel beta-helix repeat-containing protein [Mycobacteriales bacterium]